MISADELKKAQSEISDEELEGVAGAGLIAAAVGVCAVDFSAGPPMVGLY